jgi:putative holliday junction resolvase
MSDHNDQPSSLVRRGRLLGLDHGDKHIGLALSDAAWFTVRPLMVIKRRTKAEDFAVISDVIAKQQVVGVVVGLPLNPDRDEDDADTPTRASTVRRWASRLAAVLKIPVYLWEEQFSTSEAEAILAERDIKADGRIDDHAAAVILQTFIDAHPLVIPLPDPIKRIVGKDTTPPA